MTKGWDIDPSRFMGQVADDVGGELRATAMEILSEVVYKSPVGNPSIWEVNQTATQYNNAVSEWNSALRDDPGNLTKSGRLKKGLLVKDGMDIKQPKQYRAGTFRGSHLVSVGGPDMTVTTHQDVNGAATIAAGNSAIGAAPNYSVIYVQTNQPYAEALENGHSKQAPGGVYAVSFHGVSMAGPRGGSS